jgi:hypothetical protein
MMWMWLLYTDRPGYASRLLLANYRPRERVWALESRAFTAPKDNCRKVPCERGYSDCGRGCLDGGLLSGRGMGASTGAIFRSKSALQGNSSALGLILGRTITCPVTCTNTNRVPTELPR